MPLLDKTPSQAHELIRIMLEWCANELHLQHWNISFKLSSDIPGAAQNSTVVEYDNARLVFDTLSIIDEGDLFRLVVHELLHTQMAPLFAYSQLVDKSVAENKVLHAVLEEAYRHADEQVTTRLDRILAPLLWPRFKEYYDELQKPARTKKPEPAKPPTTPQITA